MTTQSGTCHHSIVCAGIPRVQFISAIPLQLDHTSSERISLVGHLMPQAIEQASGSVGAMTQPYGILHNGRDPGGEEPQTTGLPQYLHLLWTRALYGGHIVYTTMAGEEEAVYVQQCIRSRHEFFSLWRTLSILSL